MRCKDCVFMEICQDMSASHETCRLFDRLPEAVEAVKACRYSGECKNHLTVAEAKKFVEERNENEQRKAD